MSQLPTVDSLWLASIIGAAMSFGCELAHMAAQRPCTHTAFSYLNVPSSCSVSTQRFIPRLLPATLFFLLAPLPLPACR